MLGDRLLKPSAYTWPNGTVSCDKNVDGPLWNRYCGNTSIEDALEGRQCESFFTSSNISYVPGIPGFFDGVIKGNWIFLHGSHTLTSVFFR